MVKSPTPKAANADSPVKRRTKTKPEVKSLQANSAAVAPAKTTVVSLVPTPQPASHGNAQDRAPRSTANALKKKELIDQIATSTGAKKPQVRDIVEATLAALGNALSQGTMLNLPPFGKAKVTRATDAGSGKPMTIKLHRAQAVNPKQSLADDED
jgi:nucleoid DNA-binding protein